MAGNKDDYSMPYKFCRNFFINNIFITSIGLVCKNGGVRVMQGVFKYEVFFIWIIKNW